LSGAAGARWTAAQHAFAVKAFYKNNNYSDAQRLFSRHFNINRSNSVPVAHAIKTWVKNFEETVGRSGTESTTLCSVIEHFRQEFMTNFTQGLELPPLQDPGCARVRKKLLNQPHKFVSFIRDFVGRG
jgi:hypothetical protein